MTILVDVILLGWIPVILVMFAILPPRRAVIVAFAAAWMFLPVAGYALPGLPDFDKMTATSLGVLLGVCLFDASRIVALRVSPLDLPMVVWCLCPMASSYLNGLGLYDGASAMLDNIITWGLPYYIGRLYFSDLEGLRELAIGIFIATLVYMPFCLYEAKMSPRLHRIVYGFYQHSFRQTMRWGGWRPQVFMEHGLMVGLWMAGGVLTGAWLWFAGAIRRVWIVPASLLVAALLITTVLCKSAGALLLLVGALGVLVLSHFLRTRAMVALLVLTPALYIGARLQGWTFEPVTDAIEQFSEERAGSLRFRIDAEVLLIERAKESPVYGWGSWSGNRVRDERGRDVAVTDSLWILAFGQKGFVGLVSVFTVLMLPAYLLYRRFPASEWRNPAVAPFAALAMVVAIFALDSLVNAMFNPVFVVAAGAVIGAGSRRLAAPQPAAPAAPAAPSSARTPLPRHRSASGFSPPARPGEDASLP